MKLFYQFTIFAAIYFSFCITNLEARGFRHQSRNSSSSTSESLTYMVDKSPTYSVEKQLLRLVNEERRKYNLPLLILDKVLHLKARQHCCWMAHRRSMIHSVGVNENIAMGQSTAYEAMQSWMNSSGHRANILNPSYTKIGLAGYISENGVVFWCQNFE